VRYINAVVLDLIRKTIRDVCDRLWALIEGKAGGAMITAWPEILYTSPSSYVIAEEKGVRSRGSC
jgi:hypothetical protein